MERGPRPAALFALHPLPTVREIDLGGGVFFLFFLQSPLSLPDVRPHSAIRPGHVRLSIN